MVEIIGEGTERDRNAVALATKKGRWIRNERRLERAPAALDAAAAQHRRQFPQAKLRSSTNTYNCIGMVFAARRAWIQPDELDMIFVDDEFEVVSGESQIMPGDLVVYQIDREFAHVGVVLEKRPIVRSGDFEFLILSKWGADGEYIHALRDVPEVLGHPAQFLSERKK